MPSIDDLARTERLAWDVAEGAPTDEVARVMCDVLGGCDAFASLVDPASGTGVAQGFAYLDPALRTLMAHDFGTPDTNPVLRALPVMPRGRFIHCTGLLDVEKLRRTRFHADWWIPSGVGHHSGGMSLQSPDGRIAFVVLGCLGDRDWFDTGELDYIHAACDSTARALRAVAAFQHRTACAGVAGRAPDPSWLLGRARDVRIANGPARRMTERHDGPVRLRRRSLVLRHAGRDPDLAALVAGVCEGLRPHGRILIREPRGFAHLTVEPGPRYRDERSALVTLRRPRPMSWTRDTLRAAYDLTPREADVAMALAADAGPAQIAATLGLTTGSVRIYLKRIYTKTETRGQASLVSRLATGRRP